MQAGQEMEADACGFLVGGLNMPWSKKQTQVAEAVAHGWQPKGSAKGFTKGFASQVIAEGQKGKKKKKPKMTTRGEW